MPACRHDYVTLLGFDENGRALYRCKGCGLRYSPELAPIDMDCDAPPWAERDR